MHKNKSNKLCKSNENIRSKWKMIDGKTKKTYIELNETMRNKWDERKKYDKKRTGSISNRNHDCKEYIDSWYTSFAAGAVLISIPIAILFLFMQRYYVDGVSGAVKG